MITQKQLEQLLQDYAIKLHEDLPEPRPEIATIINNYRASFKEAIAFIEQNVREDVFNLAAMGASDANTTKEQEAHLILLHRFLDAVIQSHDEKVTFHSDVAPGIKAMVIDPALPASDHVFIYDGPQNLSLREKYIRGILTANHWLTDLDLQRMVQACGAQAKIKIMPFTKESIGAALHLVKRDNATATEPYSIPLLLNKGGAGEHQGVHWLAATITVDPVGHTIQYQIDDSLRLSESEREAYLKSIEDAIHLDDGFHKAFPISDGWSIDADNSSVVGNQSQRDGYSCGYRALHTLLLNPDIRGNNEAAVKYAGIDATSSDALVSAFYEEQLQDLRIEREIYEALGVKASARFKHPLVHKATSVAINEEALSDFLGTLPAQPMTLADESIENPTVGDFVRSYTPEHPLMRFPTGVKDVSLGAIQYERLFKQLSQVEGLAARPLPRMVLSHVDNAALDGINAFFDNNQIKLFNELQIDLDLAATDDVDAFVSKLKFALNNLSRSDLSRLVIADEKGVLTSDHVRELRSFIEAKTVAVAIDLPASFRETTAQRQLDQVIEINRRLKNNELLAGKIAAQPTESQREASAPVRRRARIDLRHARKIDIELQEGVEEDVVVESFAPKKRGGPEHKALNVLRLEQLKEAVTTNNFQAFNGTAYGLSKTALVAHWHTVFGNIVHGTLALGLPEQKKLRRTLGNNIETVGQQWILVNQELSGISTAAFAKTNEFSDHFADGINIHQLPPGFVLVSDPENPDAQVLHYDASVEAQSTLFPKLTAKAARQPLSMDLVKQLLTGEWAKTSLDSIWQSLNASQSYSRKDNECFRQYLPELMRLNEEQLANVMALCGSAEAFDVGKLKFIFEHLNEARASHVDPYDETVLADIRWMETIFPSPEARERFVTLAHSIQPKEVAKHPLFTLLETAHADALLVQLRKANTSYPLTDVELNGLLTVYDQYGPAGVEKILNTWQDINALPNLNITQLPSVLKNVASYESMLFRDDVLNAAKTINGLSSVQRQWWDTLYQAHQPKDDNLIDLVRSFTGFVRAVESKDLEFYSLDGVATPFSGAGNMPMALGRMLSILDLSDSRDQFWQWRAMAHINLSAQGALRALTDGLKGSRPCSFVIPEMALDPETTIQEEVYDTSIYDTSRNYKAIVKTTEDERLKQFYRFIAHQKYRMPLSFYQEAVGELERIRRSKELPAPSVNQLYALLSEATTGDNCRYFIKSVDEARAQWQSIVDNIKHIQLPVKTEVAKGVATDLLMGLERLPALPVLATLVQLITKSLQNVGVFDLPGLPAKMNRFGPSNDLLNKFVAALGSKIYLGMKFYSEADFTRRYPVSTEEESAYPGGRDLFEEHLAVSVALDKKAVAHELLSLISTFKINTANAVEVAHAVQAVKSNDEFNDILLNYALELFQDVETVERLDYKALVDFLNQLTPVITEQRERFTKHYRELEQKVRSHEATNAEIKEFGKLGLVNLLTEHNIPELKKDAQPILVNFSKDALQKAVEAQFKGVFPPTYFATLRAGTATGDVAQRINDVFKNTELRDAFERIRVRYHAENSDEMMSLVDSFEVILNQLDSQHKRIQLLEKLTDERLLAVPVSQYNQLLTAIAEHGSSGFIYFMEADDNFPKKPVEGLALKAGYFISEALPRLREDLKPSRQLGEMDVIGLVADLVLAGKGDEINATLDINQELTKACQRVQKTLSSSPAIPEDIERVLNETQTAHPALRSLEAIVDLKAHLAWLTVPETETVKIPKIKFVEVEITREVTGIAKTARNFLSSWTWGVVEKAPETEVVKELREETYEEEEIRPVDKKLDDKLVEAALSEINEITRQSTTYTFALSQTFGLIKDLVDHYPAAKSLLLPLTRQYLSFRPTQADAEERHIGIAHRHLALLHQEFLALDDQDLVISLCEHFGGKDSTYNFETLLHILKGETITISQEGEALALDFKPYPTLAPRAKKQVLLVVSSLLNNDKPCSLKDIQDLINHCHDETHGHEYVTVLETVFRAAPFPTLDKVDQWNAAAKGQSEQSFKDYITEQYKTWSKAPVAREESVNGFDLTNAKDQCARMQGMTYSQKELEAIDREVKAAQQLDTEALLQQIQDIKDKEKENSTKLVALMAELLYRTKGLPQKGIGESREYGRSFEINTTQYLAIHSMLKAGGHVTSQIGTGEGKSRIMMISIACQYALGRTVDFVTADVSLATRDYLEYQAFFKALGAQTNLIMANTPASEYRIGGINFSDASNLSLFRNKARSEGKGELVIAEDPNDRALMLDEADKTYFDAADTRFNYSAHADPAIRDMPWVYELMVEFFSDPKNRDLYDGPASDADRCNQAFKDFARGKLDEAQMKRLEAISVKQLEAWESSALTALSLEFQEDFTLRSDVTILTKHGPKQVSQAQLISGGRASENAKFSFGVHQCLHARLNQERKRAKATLLAAGASLTPLQQQLIDDKFKYPFSIDSENQIIYSSTSKSLLDDYSEGELLAVTGTAGSIQEQEEAKAVYGSNASEMTFIDMPRHRGQKRIDLPVALANNEVAHHQKILSAVREAIRRKQPVLLVCENDEESQTLHLFLKKNLSTAEESQLKRISADTKLAEEASHVKETAGQPGAITVTTAMLGRGTDIKLHGVADHHGLSVIATYLPRERDYFQIVGRSGRFGAKGDSRLILDKERLKVRFGVDVLPTEFYTATESYLRHQQARMDEFAQKQRVIKDVVGDFRLALTKQFFNQFYAPVYKEGNDKDTLLQSWRGFFDKTDKAWNDVWPKISEQLSKEPVNRGEIDTLLSQYQASVQEEWKAMREYLQAQIRDGKITSEAGESKVDACLNKEVGQIKLEGKTNALIGGTLSIPPYRTVVAKRYDEAFVGRAVIYRNFGDRVKSFFSNITAAWRGDGPWFPNYKAARNGHMSWSQFFFGARGKPLTVPEPPEPPRVAEPTASPTDGDYDEPIAPSSYSMVTQKLPDHSPEQPKEEASVLNGSQENIKEVVRSLRRSADSESDSNSLSEDDTAEPQSNRK
ncbi:hypothetical protein [Legionella yabuuchiae]|uniref:preprotein translocase subunit SecA n=1 Tax=Legionella yabuuchiae TaxID=376727 RepID=UPI0010566691|nr:hypothetical protein [Legionella yabuuchiae]